MENKHSNCHNRPEKHCQECRALRKAREDKEYAWEMVEYREKQIEALKKQIKQKWQILHRISCGKDSKWISNCGVLCDKKGLLKSISKTLKEKMDNGEDFILAVRKAI